MWQSSCFGGRCRGAANVPGERVAVGKVVEAEIVNGSE